MARFSLGRFGRSLEKFGQRIQKALTPSPPPRQPEPRQPEPRQPEARPTRDPFRKEWNRQHGLGSYRRNLKAFHKAVDPIESDPDEQLELWESFVKHINKGEGRFRRNSSANMFWRDSGIDPRDFDWKTWRDAMGFIGKRRSRTP